MVDQATIKKAKLELEQLDLLYWCYEILMERSGLDETELDELCDNYEVKVTIVPRKEIEPMKQHDEREKAVEDYKLRCGGFAKPPELDAVMFGFSRGLAARPELGEAREVVERMWQRLWDEGCMNQEEAAAIRQLLDAAPRWVEIKSEDDLPAFETDRDCWFAYRDTGEPVKVFWRHNWDAQRKAEIVYKYSAWVPCFEPAPFIKEKANERAV